MPAVGWVLGFILLAAALVRGGSVRIWAGVLALFLAFSMGFAYWGLWWFWREDADELLSDPPALVDAMSQRDIGAILRFSAQSQSDRRRTSTWRPMTRPSWMSSRPSSTVALDKPSAG